MRAGSGDEIDAKLAVLSDLVVMVKIFLAQEFFNWD